MKEPKLFFHASAKPAGQPYHYKECGLTNVYLMNGYTMEKYDGEEYVSVDNVEALWKAIGLNLVTSQKMLLPTEVRFLRNQMTMTQAELAHLLRVDDQTVARWEKGLSKVPGPADVALRMLFLAAPVAQPEGKKVLTRFIELVDQLVETDAPTDDRVLFAQNGEKWEREQLIDC